MDNKEKQDKKEKVKKAKLLFRGLAKRNKDWNGIAEINKWRDKRK